VVAPAEATPAGPSVCALLQQTLPTRPSRERPAMSAPVGTRQAKLEQLRELEAKVNGDRQQLVHLRATLEKGCFGCGDGGAARHRARDINHRINNDEGATSPQSLHGQARTSLQRPYSFGRCQSPPPRKDDKSATSFAGFSKVPWYRRLRALRLNDVSPRPSCPQHLLGKKGRPWSTLSPKGCQNTSRRSQCVLAQ
jgi:hypothetical protein